jgi:hypothetical protein
MAADDASSAGSAHSCHLLLTIAVDRLLMFWLLPILSYLLRATRTARGRHEGGPHGSRKTRQTDRLIHRGPDSERRLRRHVSRRLYPEHTKTWVFAGHKGHTRGDHLTKLGVASNHALRRAYASEGRAAGVPKDSIRRFLNHSGGDITLSGRLYSLTGLSSTSTSKPTCRRLRHSRRVKPPRYAAVARASVASSKVPGRWPIQTRRVEPSETPQPCSCRAEQACQER